MRSFIRLSFVAFVLAIPAFCDAQAPDALKPNDTAATATDITTPFIAGGGVWIRADLSLRTPKDVNWFHVTLPANADGNLVATVSDMTGDFAGMVQIVQKFPGDAMVPVAAGPFAPWTQGTGSATVYAARPGAEYWIQVSSPYLKAGGYQLRVSVPLDAQPKDRFQRLPPGNGASWFATMLPLKCGTTTETSLSIYQTGYTEWFWFIAPYGSGGSAHIRISNVSGGLIASATLYAGSPAAAGTTVTARDANGLVSFDVPGVTPGMPYYLKVTGASNTTGRYDMTVSTDMPGALIVANYFPLTPGNSWYLRGTAVAVIFSMPVAMTTRVGNAQPLDGVMTVPLTMTARVRETDLPITLYAAQGAGGTDIFGLSFPGAVFERHPIASFSVTFPEAIHLPSLIALPESGVSSGTFYGNYNGTPIKGTCTESFVMVPCPFYTHGKLKSGINLTLNFSFYANTRYGFLSMTGTQSLWLVQGAGIVQINSTNVLSGVAVIMNLAD